MYAVHCPRKHWDTVYELYCASANVKHTYNTSLNKSFSGDQHYRFRKFLIMKKEFLIGLNVNVRWGVLLFYIGSSSIELFTFFKLERISKFPLLGSLAHLWSISGHSELKHVLPKGKIHYSMLFSPLTPFPQNTTSSSVTGNHLYFMQKHIYMTRIQQLAHL